MLALAGPAGAAERVASFPAHGFGAVAGVTPLGNGEVAYGHRLASGGWWLGTTERTVATVPRAAAAQLVDVRLAASPERFAWTRGVDTIRRLRIPDPLLE